MLQTNQRRIVSGFLAQSANNVVLTAGGGHGEAAMGKSQHSVAVRTLPSEETRPAGGTRGSGTIRLPEKNALRSQSLEVGGWNRVTVRTGKAPRIVGMNIEDIGARRGGWKLFAGFPGRFEQRPSGQARAKCAGHFHKFTSWHRIHSHLFSRSEAGAQSLSRPHFRKPIKSEIQHPTSNIQYSASGAGQGGVRQGLDDQNLEGLEFEPGFFAGV